MTFDINSTEAVPTDEGQVVDLSNLADEPSQGAWPVSWYKARIVEGYSTRKGTQFATEDIPSKAGDSRNLRLCFAVTNSRGETRNLQHQFNYRTDDFTPEKMAAIKEARKEFQNLNKWPGNARDLQRSSLALSKLGQLQKAVGLSSLIFVAPGAGLDSSVFVNRDLDIKLGVDENGFNEAREFAPAGSKTGGK
jgi:hypothetical protein